MAPTASIIVPTRRRPDYLAVALASVAPQAAAFVEEWNEPEYVSVKCRDPDGYVVEAAWEPCES